MKRFIAITLPSTFLFLFVFGVTVAHAAQICPKGGDFNRLCNLKPEEIGTYVGNVVTLLFVIAIMTALIFLVWGGVRWAMSGGDKAKIQSGRDTVVSAGVGLVIALLSFLILNSVTYFVLGKSITDIKFPTLQGGQ
jgi:Type IV secretion system pilin